MRHARVGAEDQRLDRHRHGEGRHAHAAQIDVVEVPQSDAVEHQHLGRHAQLVLEDRAERLGDIAVQDDEQRFAVRIVRGSASTMPRARAGNARIRRRAAHRNASATSDSPSTISKLAQ